MRYPTNLAKCWVSFLKRHVLQVGIAAQRSGSATYTFLFFRQNLRSIEIYFSLSIPDCQGRSIDTPHLMSTLKVGILHSQSELALVDLHQLA
jgi:hypothetical protein